MIAIVPSGLRPNKNRRGGVAVNLVVNFGAINARPSTNGFDR
jgi:hypothetical protein